MRKKVKILILILLIGVVTVDPVIFITDTVRSQATGTADLKEFGPYDPIWWKTYGGPGLENGYAVLETSDGGLIILGSHLVKTDAFGNEVWKNTSISGTSIRETSDNGFIIVGSYAEKFFEDIRLIKINFTGHVQWSRTFGETFDAEGISVLETSDGGFIILGNLGNFELNRKSFYDMWLIKTDSYGIEQWNRTYGWGNYDQGHSIQQLSDEGYIIVGSTQTYTAGLGDVWLIKINSKGEEEWNTSYGGKAYDAGFSVKQTEDSGFIIGGLTMSYAASTYGFWLIKTDFNGREQWNKTYSGGDEDRGRSVELTKDGGYIIVGSTNSFGNMDLDFFDDSTSDVWLIKTDNNGNIQWWKTFGGSENDNGVDVIQTSDGNYLVAGTTESFNDGRSEMVLIKFNSSMNEFQENTVPIISITDLLSYIEPINGTFKFQGQAYDLENNLESVEIKIDNGKWQVVNGISNWDFYWNSTEVDNGRHTVYFRAFDGELFSANKSVNIYIKNEKEDKDDIKNLIYIILLIIIVIMLLIATLYILIKKAKSAENDDEQGQSKD